LDDVEIDNPMDPKKMDNHSEWTEAERLTAYHEAGHALMAHLCGQQITEVEIVGDADHAGSVQSLSFPADPLEQGNVEAEHDAIERRLKCVLAGTVAEAIVTGRTGWDESCEDLDIAVRLAMPLVDDCEDVVPFLEDLGSQIKDDLRAHWDTIEVLVTELLQRKSLTGGEVRRIIESEG
jgi:ATP-dependent Zn protease